MDLLKPEIVVQFPQSSESIVLPQDELHLDLAGRGRACPQDSAKGQLLVDNRSVSEFHSVSHGQGPHQI